MCFKRCNEIYNEKNKLKGNFNHLECLYKNEKVATKAKLIKIAELGKQVSKLEKGPNDKNHVQNLLKEKDKEMFALKKKFNILVSEHPQMAKLFLVQS